MTELDLLQLLKKIQAQRAESSTLEIKSAQGGTPEKLYDTLSSFSNQDDGGIFLFGVDEKNNFAEVGVYNAQDLQKHVAEQCEQMEPKVRPLFTVASKEGKTFVAAEIPGIDVADRPCYYRGRGRMKGSFVRVGDADEPMTEYEIYSYEAFRKKYQDDIRTVERATIGALDAANLQEYLIGMKRDRPNLAALSDDRICELLSITRDNVPTISAIMLFGSYPQAYFPQLCITAISVPGEEIGAIGSEGDRFLDNKRIEGTLPEMLEGALAFVRKNMKVKTIIQDGKRIDKTEYPMTAVREAVLNALIHRDYSIHTEGKPIQIVMYRNRMEIVSPGGLYGRLRIDQLGKVQPDTRNPVLAVAMENLKKTENRYSGIPTIYREMQEAGLPAPVFEDIHGSFCVKLFNATDEVKEVGAKDLLEFCTVPRTRQEIADFLEIKTVPFAMKTYVAPLIEQGLIELKYPDKPQSRNQRFVTKTNYQS